MPKKKTFSPVKEIDIESYSEFIVTGQLYRSNRRFRTAYSATRQGAMTAFNINLWRGTVWGVRKDNQKREMLKRVEN